MYIFAWTPSKLIALLMWTVSISPNGVHNREVLLYYHRQHCIPVRSCEPIFWRRRPFHSHNRYCTTQPHWLRSWWRIQRHDHALADRWSTKRGKPAKRPNGAASSGAQKSWLDCLHFVLCRRAQCGGMIRIPVIISCWLVYSFISSFWTGLKQKPS